MPTGDATPATDAGPNAAWDPAVAAADALTTSGGGWALVVLLSAAAVLLWRRLARLQRELQAQARARALAERQLVDEESRLQTIFESQPECVKLHSADGTILQMNRAGVELVGAQTADQVIGRTVYEFIAPEYQEHYRAVSEAVFEGRSGSMEFRLMGLQGHQRMLETRIVPMRDAQGSIVAALALTRDITERQAAEERARRHLSELARVARIASMGEMASGIAHELNQPLAAIVNHAGACLRRLQSRPQRLDEVIASLREISTQGRRAGQIIRNVRDRVSRSEPSRSAVDLNEVVRMMAGLAEPEAKRLGVILRCAFDGALPPVPARRIEIEQVVFNLLRNAIEAMGGAGAAPPLVTVSTRSAGDAAVEVAVEDSGPGIAPADLEHVFDPFFSTKPDGMGMGLSISRSIVEAHEGRMSVRPNRGPGVTFSFTLPIAVQEMVA